MSVIPPKYGYTIIYIMFLVIVNIGSHHLLSAQEKVVRPIESTEVRDSNWIKGMMLLNKDSVFKREYDKRHHIGTLLSDKGDYNAAIYWYLYALKSPDIKRKDSIHIYDNHIATNYFALGKFEESMNVLLRAIRQSEDSNTINRSNLRIASIYSQLRRFDKALDITDHAITYFTTHKDSLWLAMAYREKGDIYGKQSDYNKQLEYNLIAQSLLTQMAKNPSLDKNKLLLLQSNSQMIINNIAATYVNKENPDSALFYLKKINLEDTSVVKEAVIRGAFYSSYANAYMLKKNYRKAISYFEKALHLQNASSGFYAIRLSAYTNLSKMYADMGQHLKAWHYERAYSQLYEEVISQENINKINQLQSQYTIEKKEQELVQKNLLLKNQDLKLKQKNNLVYFLLLLSAFSVILVLVLIRNYKVRKRLAQASLLNLERENDISVIAATLQGEEMERERIARELHDSIVSEVTILKMNVFQLGKRIRDINSYAEYKALLQQSESIKNRIRQVAHDLIPVRLQKLGLHNAISTFINRISNSDLSFHFQTVGQSVTLPAQKEKVVFMIIQELVQNIVRHSHATEAMVQLNYFKENLTLTVEDNGVGMDNPNEEEDGMGLYNIRHYVYTLNGHMDINSSGYTGTTVLIELPYETLLSATHNHAFS